MKTLDDLRAEMPDVFDLRDSLQRALAVAETAHHGELRILQQRYDDDSDKFREIAGELANKLYWSMKPTRDYIDAIDRAIADVIGRQSVPLMCVPISALQWNHIGTETLHQSKRGRPVR